VDEEDLATLVTVFGRLLCAYCWFTDNVLEQNRSELYQPESDDKR
jgi:hypothetical protein